MTKTEKRIADIVGKVFTEKETQELMKLLREFIQEKIEEEFDKYR